MDTNDILAKEQFNEILDFYSTPSVVNRDYLYEVYSSVVEGIAELTEKTGVFANVKMINHFEIIQYALGEYIYSVATRNDKEREEFDKNEVWQESMTGVVADKYLTLSQFAHQEKKMTNLHMPPISTLAIYVNFMLNILQGYEQNDPKTTLVTDLLKKAVSITKCSLELLVDGFETEAFSCWRTLHECECTLILLNKYGDPLIENYLKHMKFGIAFRDVLEDKEKQTEIFNSMKEEMKQYDLKSKDIKKYIEYGWAYNIPGVKEDETFKLNFRDGIEKIAGLSQYAKRYEMSSEIIHGTPMLIYSNKQYFYYVTLLSLYESFFRLEQVFVNLFAQRVGPDVMAKYGQMRQLYYQQLVSIHQRETQMFQVWKNSGNKKEN